MLSRTDVHPTAPAEIDLEPAGRQGVGRLAETLEESEGRLQIALEAGGMGIWEIDVVTGGTTWWPGMGRLHGVDEEAPSPDRAAYLAMIHPDDRQRFRDAVDRSIAGSGWHRVEYRVVWPDGSVRW